MYEKKEDGSIDMRLAISENFNCTGLKERLTQEPNPDPLKRAKWMDGYLVLHFMPYNEETSRPKRSPEKTTENAASIDNRFKNGRWKLMNFGNRPSPWIATEKSVYSKRDVPQCRSVAL